ncbi:MAG: hypothetical protein KI785_03410 [Devosiaceae bacterium]|nr:hypothetical protein [Devosiaceae bacterium MH13]
MALAVLELIGDNRLSKLISYTVFPDLYAGDKQQYTETLLEIALRIKRARAASKRGLRLLSLSTFGVVRSAAGDSLRHVANVIAVFGIEVDYDAGVMSFKEAVKRLEAACITAIIYTSPSTVSMERVTAGEFYVHSLKSAALRNDTL